MNLTICNRYRILQLLRVTWRIIDETKEITVLQEGEHLKKISRLFRVIGFVHSKTQN